MKHKYGRQCPILGFFFKESFPGRGLYFSMWGLHLLAGQGEGELKKL